MNRYDRRIVTAPDWMKEFTCIANKCSETCCQQWNIDVDPIHAECYTHLGDPELQMIMDGLLHRFQLRRSGMRKPELQYRFLLTNQAEQRCPLLNEEGFCRLQKKYGAEILCDTCYFHPRTFWQMDEKVGMSACLSCPECARLALLHEEPTSFTQFETTIDPNAEWLETSLISDPDTRLLMQNREKLIQLLIAILQDRSEVSFSNRMVRAIGFLNALMCIKHPDPQTIQDVYEETVQNVTAQDKNEGSETLIQRYLTAIDPVNDGLEKAAQGAEKFTRALAGGKEGFVHLLAQNYDAGSSILEPFLSENRHLIENFMVHCVFSDSFKQFYRCLNEPVTVPMLLRHEAALLELWYLFLRVLLAQAALTNNTMTEDIFMKTIIHADKTFWHYPDWFSRCAERV